MRSARDGVIGLTALVVVLAAGVVGVLIYRESKAAPAPPVYDAVVTLEAAPAACAAAPLGYEIGEQAEACQDAFSIGAMNAWDEGEQRWTTPAERDAGYESSVSALGKRDELSDLTPKQVNSRAFLEGYAAGISWMEDEAPRA